MTTVAEPVTDLEALLDNETTCTFKMLDARTGEVKLECTQPISWVGKLECGHQLHYCDLHRVTVCKSVWPLRCSTCRRVYPPKTGVMGWHRV